MSGKSSIRAGPYRDYVDIPDQLTKSQFAMFEASPVPVFIIDREHRIIFWNRACKMCTGLQAEEMIGSRDAWKAFYSQKRPVLADLILTGSASTMEKMYGDKELQPSFVEGGYQAEEYFPSHDRWIRFTAAPVRDHNNEIVAVIETLHDISKVKKAESIMLETRMHMESIRQEKNELIFDLERELRTPLKMIHDYADLLLNMHTGELSEEQRHFAGMISFSGSCMVETLDSMVLNSGIYEENRERGKDMFSLPVLIFHIRKILGTKARKKNVRMDLDIDPHINVICTDKSGVKAILYHIISNAISSTSSGGTLSLNVRQNEKKDLYLIVRDAGTENSEFDVKVSYSAFVQLGVSGSNKKEAGNCRSPIIKKFVEIHGDQAVSVSGSGKITEFDLMEPVVRSSSCDVLHSLYDPTVFQ